MRTVLFTVIAGFLLFTSAACVRKRSSIPERKSYANTFTNLAGMNEEVKTNLSFKLDLGQTFQETSVVQVIVYVDTSNLQYDKESCPTSPVVCPDKIKFVTVMDSSVEVAMTQKGRMDAGEQLIIEKNGRNAEHFPAAAKQVATGTITMTVEPSAGDFYTVHEIAVAVTYDSSKDTAQRNPRCPTNQSMFCDGVLHDWLLAHVVAVIGIGNSQISDNYAVEEP